MTVGIPQFSLSVVNEPSPQPTPPTPPTPPVVPVFPAKASSPSPANGSSTGNYPGILVLSWDGDPIATSYTVWLNGLYQGLTFTNSFIPPLLNTSTVYHWRVDSLGPDGLTQGDNWAFITAPTVYPPTPPPKATSPSPTNGETNVLLTSVILSWASGGDTLSYDVYLNGVFQGNQSGTTFSAGTLAANTLYTWRIDPVNAVGTTTGDTWQFTTGAIPLPLKATTPTPANGEAAQDPTGVTLSWVNGGGATSYDIYINGVFQVNQAGTSYNAGNLNTFDAYTWRIDAVNGFGTTTGDTWSFDTTGHATVVAWAARVVTNGGAAPSVATKRALHTFCVGLDTDSLTASMIAVNCIVPDNLIAATTPLIKGPGLDPWANTGFAAGDLTVNGIQGADGKYLDTGVVPSTAISADTSGGLTVYFYTGAKPSAYAMGASNADYSNAFAMEPDDINGFGYFDCYGFANGQGRLTGNVGTISGYISGNRTAANATAMYNARSAVAHTAILTGSGAANQNRPAWSVYFGAVNNGGAPSANPFNMYQRASFAAVHKGLSSALSAKFYARIQALRTALGGGYL